MSGRRIAPISRTTSPARSTLRTHQTGFSRSTVAASA
jgi:hypothetical protein